jgi:hypothetical protein
MTSLRKKEREYSLLCREWPRCRMDCRRELARDGFKGGAFIQKTRVIVNVHREQARSYKKPGVASGFGGVGSEFIRVRIAA